MIKADMHIHSTVSDGSFTIPELISRAKENSLDAIVITDHDTLSHSKQLPEHSGIRVTAGIEISAFDYEKNFRVHILGYNIRNIDLIEKTVRPTLEARHENSIKQIGILNQYGYEIDINELRKADGKYIYKQHIMENLVRRKKADEMFGNFYYSTFKNGGICAFDIRYISPLEAREGLLFWHTVVSSRISALYRSLLKTVWTVWSLITILIRPRTGKPSENTLKSILCS